MVKVKEILYKGIRLCGMYTSVFNFLDAMVIKGGRSVSAAIEDELDCANAIAGPLIGVTIDCLPWFFLIMITSKEGSTLSALLFAKILTTNVSLKPIKADISDGIWRCSYCFLSTSADFPMSSDPFFSKSTNSRLYVSSVPMNAILYL